jgi:predicted enzyme related to lactoylglutathione lyase
VQTIYGGTTEIMKEIIGRAWASSPEGSANVLQGVNKVLVEVSDQERAKRFWVERVGCEVAQDEAYGDERWLEVRLPDGVVLVLAQREGPVRAAPERLPNAPVFFHCDDVDATWRELVDRGVTFAQEPVDMPFGRWSMFQDEEGNRFPLTTRG